MSTPGQLIPYFDYPGHFLRHEEKAMEVIRDVLGRGAYILRKELEQFEGNLSRILGVKHAVGMADGTNAIALALLAVGIGPGDEVILPSHTCIATPSAVNWIGAVPVLAECRGDGLLDPDDIARRLTPRTRALLPVHLNGRTADMDALGEIAGRHGLVIVEDAAQALGSRFRGRAAGTFGAAGAFSFSPTKMLGCYGDGGAVVTNDDAVAERLYRLRDFGKDRQQKVRGWGTSCRLDNLQAAILDLSLGSLEGDIVRRRELAAFYHRQLGDVPQLVLPPAPDEDPRHFDVFLNFELRAENRDGLRSHLADLGIQTAIQWQGLPVHHLKVLGFETALPETDRFFERCLCLPLRPTLSDRDARTVVEGVRGFYAEAMREPKVVRARATVCPMV